MSRSVDLFIATPVPLETVAETVAGLTGFSVSPGQPGTWLVRDGDVCAVLSENRHSRDGHPPLDRYAYSLTATAPEGTRPQDSAPAALLRQVGHKLQEKSGWMMLMVLDLQYRTVGAGGETPDSGGEVPSAGQEVPA
ncbi:MAG TPA: hypothetical protein VFZ97_15250 [Acidimicrobiales bacterium]